MLIIILVIYIYIYIYIYILVICKHLPLLLRPESNSYGIVREDERSDLTD